jgi:hypothetical protein
MARLWLKCPKTIDGDRVGPVQASTGVLEQAAEHAVTAKPVDAAALRPWAAVDAVRAWRERGEVPFPDFSPERKVSMRGAIEYPPRDSARRNGVVGP